MDLDAINRFKEQQAEAQEKADLLNTITEVGDKVASAVVSTERNNKSVTITNDLAKPSDIDKVVQAVKEIDLQPQDLQPIADALTEVSQAIAKLPTEYPDFPDFPEAPEQREDVRVTNLSELKSYFEDVVKAVGALKTSIKFDPKIEVKPADVKITEQKIDLTPVTKGLASLEKAFKSIKTPNFDTSEIIGGLDKVSQTINGLSFPVPNYVLPFRDSGGAAVQTDMVPLGTQLVTANKALVTNTVIHGLTTGGGGSYVDVKVNPSGALTVENTPVSSNTGSVSTASVTNTNTTVLAANNSRLGAAIYNEGSVACFVKLGATASATSYTIKIAVDGYYELPIVYTGIITGITASGTATLRVTELT